MSKSFSSHSEDSNTALIVIDQQYDFEPGGQLPVTQGDEILDGIAQLMRTYKEVIVSQDSHPAGHISFASSYPGKKPYDLLTLDDLNDPHFHSHFTKEVVRDYLESVPEKNQTLWPDHCVSGTHGWEIDKRLPLDKASLILRKGNRTECDSYSAFKENDGLPTGLEGYLREKKIETVYLVGLAGDFCVNWTARDAVRVGFKVIYDSTLTRFVNPQNRTRVLQELKSLGILIKEV